MRNGFFVPSIMKRCWASQMEVVEVIRRICEDHGIRFFAAYGTLLGAVRHGGFIPWDDDLDLFMLRRDYEVFLRAAEKEFPEKFILKNMRNDKDFFYSHTTVWNMRMTRDNAFGFAFPAGVDIFPLDYLPADEGQREELRGLVVFINTLIFHYDSLSEQEQKEVVEGLSTNYGVKFDDGPIRPQLVMLVESIMAMYSREEASHLTVINNWVERYPTVFFPIESFDNAIDIPFEGIQMPIPGDYDTVLRTIFGDYTRQIREKGVHDFPYFMKLTDKLPREVLDRIFYKHEEIKPAPGILEKINCRTGKKKVLFAVTSYDEWTRVRDVYHSIKEDVECDTALVVTPYYILNGLEKWGVSPYGEPQNDYELIKEEVPEARFNDYNPEIEMPGTIYITNPYDSFSEGRCVPNKWKCTYLRQYCKELIYIAGITTDEEEPGGHTKALAKFYVNTPGVLLSDFISVQSPGVKDMYREIVSELYGEDFGETFKGRISIVNT